ncbi:MAG: SH3 domain-containing protein [Planctomycetes bacterium]|nr:SH3 domain-containing protein [Planctomycetota bacterium]
MNKRILFTSVSLLILGCVLAMGGEYYVQTPNLTVYDDDGVINATRGTYDTFMGAPVGTLPYGTKVNVPDDRAEMEWWKINLPKVGWVPRRSLVGDASAVAGGTAQAGQVQAGEIAGAARGFTEEYETAHVGDDATMQRLMAELDAHIAWVNSTITRDAMLNFARQRNLRPQQ